MKVKSVVKVFSYIFIDPLLIYIVAIYGLSRLYQYVFDVESVWQAFWERVQEVLGNSFEFIVSSI